MALGYHLVLGMYGFWLPNDPRGSGSTYVGSQALYHFGPATKVSTSHSVAHASHDHRQRLQAKKALKHSPVRLSGVQARTVGQGIGGYRQRNGLIVWACAVLPDHLHLVIGRPRLGTKALRTQLKGAAVRQLKGEGLHPEVPKLFARGGWCVFLETANEIRQRIAYVQQNPCRQGLPRQDWSFVTPFQA